MEVRLPNSNPFASACVRPGALPFIFRAGEDAQALVERLRANRWRGQIVGPHGTGKSTLLRSLVPLIEAAGRQVAWVRPPGCLVVSEVAAQALPAGPGPTQLIVDGFEQFGPVARLGWKLHSQWQNCGLLVTAHRNMGLPMLYETSVDEPLAQRVVDALLGTGATLVTPRDVSDALREHHGNLRDALFALYDLYELRKVHGVGPALARKE